MLYVVLLGAGYDREAISGYLDKHKDIDYWCYNMPNSFFIISKLSAEKILYLIRNTFGDEPNLFVSEVTKNFYGHLPMEHWEIFGKLKQFNKLIEPIVSIKK